MNIKMKLYLVSVKIIQKGSIMSHNTNVKSLQCLVQCIAIFSRSEADWKGIILFPFILFEEIPHYVLQSVHKIFVVCVIYIYI